jgi:hypothetical protein
VELTKFLQQNKTRAAAAVAFITGLVALFIGWHGTAHASLTSEQIPYIVSGAIFGLFALGTAGILWLSADLRTDWEKLDEISRALTGRSADDVAANAPTASRK